MKKLIKYLIITITLIFGINSFNAEESINVDNSYASYRVINKCNGTISGFTQLSLNESSGNLTSNNAYNRPFLYQLRIFTQGDFKKSNSYTVSYNINLAWVNINTSSTPPNTQTYINILKNANPKVSARVDNGSSWLTENIETFNVSYNYVSGNIVNVVIKFSLKQDAQYVGILFDWSGNNQCSFDGYFYEWLITALRLSAASGTYEMGTIGAIENQTNAIINGNNQINNNLDNINGSLNDSSIDNSSIGSAFNDLQNNYVSPSSMGSFSGFLTLPLSWVQTLLSGGTCSDIRLPLPFLENKYIVLPCLDTFWNSLGLLATIVELCWLAVVGTRVFNGLFTIVVDVKDPNNSQSMDLLKSWEL